MIYCTTYCNKGHRLKDGKPVAHECYVLPPVALKAEMEGDFEKAQEILSNAKPMQVMRRGVHS